jgi:hypothetical protein
MMLLPPFLDMAFFPHITTSVAGRWPIGEHHDLSFPDRWLIGSQKSSPAFCARTHEDEVGEQGNVSSSSKNRGRKRRRIE